MGVIGKRPLTLEPSGKNVPLTVVARATLIDSYKRPLVSCLLGKCGVVWRTVSTKSPDLPKMMYCKSNTTVQPGLVGRLTQPGTLTTVQLRDSGM